MAVLLWKAYLAFKQDPLVTLYEQGHLNTVFLLEGKLKYTLTQQGCGCSCFALCAGVS